jgi:Flp pilus assembly CpaF family ATPase
MELEDLLFRIERDNREHREHVNQQLETIINNQEKLMQTIDDDFTAIDAATTAAGARVDALIASIKASGTTLTTAQQAEADAIVAHLGTIGASASNPTPTPPVVPGVTP